MLFASRCRNALQTAWLAFVLSMAALSCPAQASATASAPVTVVQGDESIELSSRSQILLDKEGRYSPDDVAFSEVSQGFKPMTRPLSMGFTSATVWLRLCLSAAQAQEWWLQIDQPILEHVTVYERDPRGFWLEHSNSSAPRVAEQHIETRKPAFALQLTPDEPKLILIRLQTRTSMVSHITLWPPQKLQEKNTSESFVWGMVIGAYALVIIYYALFALWTRERVYAVYSALIFINFMAAVLTDRWNYDLGLILDPGTQVMALGLVVSLAPTASYAFQSSYARTYQYWPRFDKACLAMNMVVAVVGATLALSGLYKFSALLVQSFSIVMIAINTVVLTWLSLMRNKRAQLLLLAFTVFHFSVAWRYLRNIGHVEPSVFNEHAYQIGAFIHMLILSTGIFSGYNSLRRESERQQAKATAEAQSREQQKQFLSMVAHEVKTPLAVITASADNLLLTPGMPPPALQRVEKISRNTAKIQNIFQSYLDNEQVLNSNRPFDVKELGLGDMLQALVQDFEDTHGIHIELAMEPDIKIHADRQLLSIAIHNLLSNAHKYAASGSSILVQASRSTSYVSISVIDQGPGINSDDLQNIFKPYYRGSNSGRQQGSGLGLHLVRHIAEQHGGNATAIAQPGGGMKFVIMIPV